MGNISPLTAVRDMKETIGFEVATMVTFMVLSESMSKEAAEETARKRMAQMPAWKNIA